jgi:enoyl-CoA hydratase
MANVPTGLRVTTERGVQTWTMVFPPVNAISPEFLSAMDDALTTAEARPDVSVVVLASGLRVFSAGADAKWMKQVAEEEGAPGLLQRFNKSMDLFRELCLRIRHSDLLVLATVGGHALAGGLELAAACDLRFAADDDRIQIGATEMKLFGVMPSGGGGTQYIARLMGPSRCLQFLLEAEPTSPRQAESRKLSHSGRGSLSEAGELGCLPPSASCSGGGNYP